MRSINRLKKGKEAVSDNIKSEAWIYGKEKVAENPEEIIRRVWKGEGYLEIGEKGNSTDT